MLNTLEITRTLTDTGLKPDQAAAITHAVQLAAESGKHVTPEQFQAGIAALRGEISGHRAEQRAEVAEVRAEISEHRAEQRAEIAALRGEISEHRAEQRAEVAEVRAEISRSESRIIKWVVGIVLTAAGIVTAAGVAIGLAILRALGTLAGN